MYLSHPRSRFDDLQPAYSFRIADVSGLTDADDDRDHRKAGYRPRVPAGEEPGPLPVLPLPFGQAHVFYPVAREDRCEAALLLDLDPVGLVRGPGGQPRRRRGPEAVRQRPPLRRLLLPQRRHRPGLRLGPQGRQQGPARLAATPLPSRSRSPCSPAAGASRSCAASSSRWGTRSRPGACPSTGTSPSGGRALLPGTPAGTFRLRDLLSHLYVLLPVLDDDKHYWVGQEELDKLLARGEGWLPSHPEREQIARRYLKHQRILRARRLPGSSPRKTGCRGRSGA